ncbi:hypothetical protein Ancab_008613, partial [Ancistrocladus abbreviatus]
GADRARAAELWFLGEGGCNNFKDGGCKSSIDPLSLSINKSHERFVSPKEHKSNGKKTDSKSLDDLGQSCRLKTNIMISSKSGMAGASTSNYVSLMRNNSAGTLMAEGTFGIRRREAKGKSDFHLLKQSSAIMQEGESYKMEEGILGSTHCGLLSQLDWSEPMVFNSRDNIPSPNDALARCTIGLQPKRSGAKQNKLKGLKKKSKKKGSSIQRLEGLNTKGVKNISREAIEEPEISIKSLYDSNITNMIRIFLNKFNHITTEEIWEIGLRLGVQSSEDIEQ